MKLMKSQDELIKEQIQKQPLLDKFEEINNEFAELVNNGQLSSETLSEKVDKLID